MRELILYTLEDRRSQFELGAELSLNSVVKDSLTVQEIFA